MSEANIVRTSDRINFKRCRTLWDFGSKLRQNYEPHLLPTPLHFGTAVHAGLEIYYNPDTWTMPRDVVEALAITSFLTSCKKTKDDYLKWTAQDVLPDTMQVEYEERLDLGKGMLQNYFTWAPTKDRRFTPKFVELEFEVPIIVPDWFPRNRLPQGFTVGQRNALYFNALPVVYQGRLDSLWEDDSGHYWIVDHKTASNFGPQRHLERDEQCGSYMWALENMLGIRTQGVIYNELAKSVPHPPAELKKGGLSQNKQQNTTYEMYVAELDKRNLDYAPYQGMLEHLKEQGNKFFRRTEVPRSAMELRNLGDNIFLQAIDMFNDPLIYPNPSKMNCNGCMFDLPCLAKHDGSDLEYILKTKFHQRESSKEETVTTE